MKILQTCSPNSTLVIISTFPSLNNINFLGSQRRKILVVLEQPPHPISHPPHKNRNSTSQTAVVALMVPLLKWFVDPEADHLVLRTNPNHPLLLPGNLNPP
jgi:hypothetical protein